MDEGHRRRYDLAIFDFDGTLADSFPWLLTVFNQVATRYHFRLVETHEVETLRGYDNRRLQAYLGVPWWKLPLIAAHARRLAAAATHDIPLFPEAGEMLRHLSARGVMLAIVTSNGEATVRRVLGPGTAELVAHFESDISLFGKRRRIQRAVARSGVPRDRAIYIGDETRDIDAAREAGVAAGAVTWGFATRAALEARSPTEVFTSMDELAARLAP